jgi:alpha-mannosidase
MDIREVIVLIPSHSLEDFPTDQSEEPAAGLLNSFAVAWHPRLIAATGHLPRWHRADDPPVWRPDLLVFAPEVCNGWLPHAWVEQAREAGVAVIAGVTTRDEMVAAIDALWSADERQPLNDEFVHDFFALGTCWLQVELLTRHMRQFGTVDEVRLQTRVVSAARAVVAHDRDTASAHLRIAFEILQEARERFYPMDCYLIDLCLASPDLWDDSFTQLLQHGKAVNLLATGDELATGLRSHPDLQPLLQQALQDRRLAWVGGEVHDRGLPCLPLGSVLHEFTAGRRQAAELGLAPSQVWGRRRYGLTPLLPQLLKQFGFTGALHVVLDDGIYPDAEYSRLCWKGSDGTEVEAFSRIPLAADAATSYLRFPQRMAEAMDHDQIAAIGLARWPQVKAPWFFDLQRSQKYAPVLGRFLLLEELFELTGQPSRLCAYRPKEYFPPYLLEHVARRQADPISRYGDHLLRRRQFDALAWWHAVVRVAQRTSPETDEGSSQEERIERAGPDHADDTADVALAEAQATLAELDASTWSDVLRLILPKVEPWRPDQDPPANPQSYLLINPCSFDRPAIGPAMGSEAWLDASLPPPSASNQSASNVSALSTATSPTALNLRSIGNERGVAVSDGQGASTSEPTLPATRPVGEPGRGTSNEERATVVVPAAGFRWVSAQQWPHPGRRDAAASRARRGRTSEIADPWVIQSDCLEVTLNAETAGIALVRHPQRREQRFSQLLSFRFPRERKFRVAGGSDDEFEKSQYAATRSTGPAIRKLTAEGEALVSRGDIIDQVNGRVLARFEQAVWLPPGRSQVELEFVLTEVVMPDGDPWNNYFCCRFAWNDSLASLTRTVWHVAQEPANERLETVDYVELATETERLTLVPHGLPFHRRSGPRMLDTLLIVAGERRRRFRCTVVLDNPFPLEAAWDALTPLWAIPCCTPAPESGASGWLFHVDRRNVQLLQLRNARDLPHPDPTEPAWDGTGWIVRLIETEGTAGPVRLRTFQSPLRARLCDASGQTRQELTWDADAVTVPLRAYEIADVELRFGHSSAGPVS